MPVAKTEWVDGVVKLSGRWSFSSGCDACDWVFLGGFVPNEEGKPPDMRTFLVPRSDYEIIDNWHVSGLRGSGSKDVVVDGAFVPDHRMHKFTDGFRQQSPGNEINPSPVYKYPFGQIHVRSVSTPAVGAALGALDSYIDFMKSKVSQATGRKAKESFAKAFRCVQVGTGELVLDEGIQSLVKIFQFSQRQEDRQHFGRKAQCLGAVSQAPQQQPLHVGGLSGAGVSENNHAPSAAGFTLTKGLRQRDLKICIAATQTFFRMGGIRKGLFGNTP